MIFIYCGLLVLILVFCVCVCVCVCVCCFFVHYVSAKFHLWPSSGDLPQPRIGMMNLVTISPVITALHSCCLSLFCFWPSIPLAGLGRIWNRWLLTMLTWNRRDSTPLSAGPRAPKVVITGDTVTRLISPIRGRGKSPEEGQWWNLAET